MTKPKHPQKSKPAANTKAPSKSPTKSAASLTIPAAESSGKSEGDAEKRTSQALPQQPSSLPGTNNKKKDGSQANATLRSGAASTKKLPAPTVATPRAKADGRRDSKQESVIALLEQPKGISI